MFQVVNQLTGNGCVCMTEASASIMALGMAFQNAGDLVAMQECFRQVLLSETFHVLQAAGRIVAPNGFSVAPPLEVQNLAKA